MAKNETPPRRAGEDGGSCVHRLVKVTAAQKNNRTATTPTKYSVGRQLVGKAWAAWQLWNSQKTFYKTFPASCRPPLHKVSFSHPPPVTKSLCPAASSSARSLELGLVLPGFHCGKVNLGQNRLGRYFIIGLSEPWPGWSLQSYK